MKVLVITSIVCFLLRKFKVKILPLQSTSISTDNIVTCHLLHAICYLVNIAMARELYQ